MTESYGVGIIGTGFGGSVHIPGFQAHPRTKVVAVASVPKRDADLTAKKYGIEHAFESYREMLKLPEVQIVSVATPPFLHFEAVKDALKAGKHVLCEKSLATNVEEARQMLKLAEKSGLVHMVDFEFRYIPAWARFREMIEKVGTLYTVNVKIFRGISLGMKWTWRESRAKGGGGMVGDGCHYFDALRYWFGDIVRVAGIERTFAKEAPDPETGKPKAIDADDTFALLLEFESGGLGVVHYTSVAPGGSGAFIEVAGSHGGLALTANEEILETPSERRPAGWHGYLGFDEMRVEPNRVEIPDRLKEAHGMRYDREDPLVFPFLRLVDQVVKAVDSNTPLSPTFYDGYRAQLIMDAVAKSYKSRRWISTKP